MPSDTGSSHTGFRCVISGDKTEFTRPHCRSLQRTGWLPATTVGPSRSAAVLASFSGSASCRLILGWQATGKPPQAGAVTIDAGPRSYRLSFESDIKFVAGSHDTHFIPADELAVAGKYYSYRVRRGGIGATLLYPDRCPGAKGA
jgi:hypothetical protein